MNNLTSLFLAVFVAIFSCQTLSFSVFLAQQDGNQTTQVPGGEVVQHNGSISDYISQNESFGALAKVLSDLNLTEQLNTSNITVFAPNDEAINSLPTWVVDKFQQAKNSSATPALKALLFYHIHPTANFKPKNITDGDGQVNTTGIAPYLQFMQQNNQTDETKSISLSTALKPLNLTIYTTEEGKWFVNDAEILSVANTTNGYVFEISRIVTPLYYFNTSIYNIEEAPAPLGDNYTFPKPPPVDELFNLTLQETRTPENTPESFTFASALGLY